MSVRLCHFVLPLLLAALAACRPGEAPDLERLDPHGVPGAIATAEADPAYPRKGAWPLFGPLFG